MGGWRWSGHKPSPRADPRVMQHLLLAGWRAGTCLCSCTVARTCGSLIAALEMHRYYAATDRVRRSAPGPVSAVMQLAYRILMSLVDRSICRAIWSPTFSRLKASLLCLIASSLYSENSLSPPSLSLLPRALHFDSRARQLYKNISMLFLFPVKDGKLCVTLMYNQAIPLTFKR